MFGVPLVPCACFFFTSPQYISQKVKVPTIGLGAKSAAAGGHWEGASLLQPDVASVLSAADMTVLGTRHGETDALDASHRGSVRLQHFGWCRGRSYLQCHVWLVSVCECV